MPFTVTMPKLSPTMEEGTIAKWFKKEGDSVKSGEVIFSVATDKATLEQEALDGGVLRKILIKAGEQALVNQAVAIFSLTPTESLEGFVVGGVPPKKKEEVVVKEVAAPKQESAPSKTVSYAAFKPEPPLAKKLPKRAARSSASSPLAKKLADEKGLDLTTVKGSGPGSRVMSRDLDLAQPDLVVAFGRREETDELPGAYELEGLSPMRKVIAERLQSAKASIPHFYLMQEVRVERLFALRSELQEVGLKLSINDFVLRAVALALKNHPAVNSGFDSTTNQIIRFKTVDISVAVSVPDGLITPIVRCADTKNLGELSQEVKGLAHKAKEGRLEREEYVGGSFTLSNLGMYGISEFVAILNPPQAAILAVGASEEKAVVEKGCVRVGKVMRLTLSCDHRVIDGAEGALFLKDLQKFLENPAVLLVF